MKMMMRKMRKKRKMRKMRMIKMMMKRNRGNQNKYNLIKEKDQLFQILQLKSKSRLLKQQQLERNVIIVINLDT